MLQRRTRCGSMKTALKRRLSDSIVMSHALFTMGVQKSSTFHAPHQLLDPDLHLGGKLCAAPRSW